MIRKLIPLLLGLLLLCTFALGEETQQAQELCLLYDGDTLVATGVVLGGDAFVLTSGCAVRDAKELTVYSGDQVLQVVDAIGESYDGPVLLELDGGTALSAWYIAPWLMPEAVGYQGMLADGTPVTGACSRVSPMFADGHAAMTLTAQEGLLPGAVILDQYGAVAGLVVAAYGEGQGRYLAYTNEALYFLMTGIAEGTAGEPIRGSSERAVPAKADSYVPVFGAVMSEQDGLIQISWRNASIDPANGDRITVVMQDLENPFATIAVKTLADGLSQMAAAPGRTYLAWVMQSDSPIDLSSVQVGDEYMMLTTSDAEPFTAYDFRDTQAYVTVLPTGAQIADDEVIPAAVLTSEALENSDVYLQVTSTYAVEEQLEAVLTVVLETPEGWALAEGSGYLFMPEVMNEDNWHCPLTDLIQSAINGAGNGRLTPGSYTVTYYLDGMTASTTTFVIE